MTEKLPNFTAVSLLGDIFIPAATIIQSLVSPGSSDHHWDRDEQTECRAG